MKLEPGSPLAKWMMVKAIVDRYGASTIALVAFQILDHWNKKRDGQCNPSFQRIADDLGINRRTVIRHVRRLWRDGWLIINGRTYSSDYEYVPGQRDETNHYDFVWSRAAAANKSAKPKKKSRTSETRDTPDDDDEVSDDDEGSDIDDADDVTDDTPGSDNRDDLRANGDTRGSDNRRATDVTLNNVTKTIESEDEENSELNDAELNNEEGADEGQDSKESYYAPLADKSSSSVEHYLHDLLGDGDLTAGFKRAIKLPFGQQESLRRAVREDRLSLSRIKQAKRTAAERSGQSAPAWRD